MVFFEVICTFAHLHIRIYKHRCYLSTRMPEIRVKMRIFVY